MRSPRRRGPLEHVLVAGDLTELDAISALLAMLPHTTYGQVVVEVPEDAEVPALATPPRVNVTVLRRSVTDEAGARLATAVQCWLGEWLPEEPEPNRTVTMWVGASASGRISTSALCLERL